MRGRDYEQSSVFSYISAKRRVPQDHPLRALRAMADTALKDLSKRFDGIYAALGRPSIAPERLLRALLLQVLYTVRSERLLMEQLDYNFCSVVARGRGGRLIRNQQHQSHSNRATLFPTYS